MANKALVKTIRFLDSGIKAAKTTTRFTAKVIRTVSPYVADAVKKATPVVIETAKSATEKAGKYAKENGWI